MIKKLYKEIPSFHLSLKLIFIFLFVTAATFGEVQYEMSISSSEFVNDYVYEFDINIKSVNGSFVLTSYQSVFSFNQGIINNGELTFTFIEGTSELQNMPSTGFGINGTDGSLELTFASLPGFEDVGTEYLRVGRFRIENTNPFHVSNINLRWNFNGVITTILTGEFFADITNSGYHKNESSTGANNNSDQLQYFELFQNYPNPFNPETKIVFNLPEELEVSLTVFNALGQKVSDVMSGQLLTAGIHEILFDGTQLSSGIYFYSLQAGQLSKTKKMILLQ